MNKENNFIPENCYRCKYFVQTGNEEAERLEFLTNDGIGIPPGQKGTCLGVNIPGAIIHGLDGDPNITGYQTSSQELCHVKVNNNTVFETHPVFDMQSYYRRLREHVRNMDGGI